MEPRILRHLRAEDIKKHLRERSTLGDVATKFPRWRRQYDRSKLQEQAMKKMKQLKKKIQKKNKKIKTFGSHEE
jgi:hypothetical protein